MIKTESGTDTEKLAEYNAVELMAKEFATKHGLPFYTTSCVSGAYVHVTLKDLVDRIVRDEDIWNDLISQHSNANKVVDPAKVGVHKRQCCCNKSKGKHG